MQDDFLFFEDEAENAPVQESGKWKVLIVDDEAEVHQVTKLALAKFRFEDKPLDIHSAHSAKEAKQLLIRHPEFAMVLLDVVMETEDAGLQVVNFIRNEISNRLIRIVLRTGQPGVAPEEFVINNYDIDDYKSKTELTAQKLQTTLIASLRAYRELRRIEDIVNERTAELAERNQEILDSIRYAKRIQSAILPDVEAIRRVYPDSFVFFQPKDIVSGDFYWFSHRDDGISVFASIDCTGHGVPGALMSIIGYNILSRLINDGQMIHPTEILQELDSQIKEFLKNEGASDASPIRDGMDLSLCVIHQDRKTIEFAGANQPIYLVKDGVLTEYDGDHNPVGDTMIENKVFTTKTIQYEKGQRLYLFSDGFVDQFGGDTGKKYTYKRFKDFITGLQNMSMKEQLIECKFEFEKWKGAHRQIDDVSVIGIQLP